MVYLIGLFLWCIFIFRIFLCWLLRWILLWVGRMFCFGVGFRGWWGCWFCLWVGRMWIFFRVWRVIWGLRICCLLGGIIWFIGGIMCLLRGWLMGICVRGLCCWWMIRSRWLLGSWIGVWGRLRGRFWWVFFVKFDDDLRIVLIGDRIFVWGLYFSILIGELEMFIWGVGECIYMWRFVLR